MIYATHTIALGNKRTAATQSGNSKRSSAAARMSCPDCWIADTGCGHDLLSYRWVDDTDRKRLRNTADPLLFAGVGGTKAAKLKLLLRCPALGGTVEPLVMDDTPDVISIGWRCVELAWSFWCPPYSLHPVLTPPSGQGHRLQCAGSHTLYRCVVYSVRPRGVRPLGRDAAGF